uniref:Cystatin-B n=1 Tax=Kryptolebias marmoratus TaxID=37003 RepID=A0A3Q3AA75_KRYMA
MALTVGVGGWSETNPATEEIQKICDQVKVQVEERTGNTFKEFKVIVYRSQVVKGMNYLMKVRVGENQYFHIQVYVSLSKNVQLTGLQENHTKEDPLEPIKPFE